MNETFPEPKDLLSVLEDLIKVIWSMGLPTGFTNDGMPGSKAKDSHVQGSKHTKALSIKG